MSSNKAISKHSEALTSRESIRRFDVWIPNRSSPYVRWLDFQAKPCYAFRTIILLCKALLKVKEVV